MTDLHIHRADATRDQPAPAATTDQQWTHGTRLGRDHTSVRRHLREDHGVPWVEIRRMTDGAVHGYHDGDHNRTWAYAYDLPHSPMPVAEAARRHHRAGAGSRRSRT